MSEDGTALELETTLPSTRALPRPAAHTVAGGPASVSTTILERRSPGIAVELRRLAVRYGAVPVLRQVELLVNPGETLAVIGPSGCGKSTLLRCLAGFVTPAAGEILFDGVVVGSPRNCVAPERRNIGFMFQSFALWPHLSVRDNVAYPWKIRGMPKRQRRELADAALERVGLGGFGDRSPSGLSGGQQQRVALARALAGEPRLVLLDEPLSSVDVALRDELQRLISSLVAERGLTMVVATHDRDEAAALADRIAVLDQEMIVQVGTSMELYDRPANPFVAQFMGATNIFDAIVASRSRAGAVTALASVGDGASPVILSVSAADEVLDHGADVSEAAHQVSPSDAAQGAVHLKDQRFPVLAGSQTVVAVVWPDQVLLDQGVGLPGVVTRVSLRAGHREVTVRVADLELRAWEDGSRSRVVGEQVTVALGRVRLFSRGA
jgi:ABC-type Fe3+/spermidine/putrescine transport system ATPase subunit